MTEIYIDANVAIDYARERALHELRIESANRKAGILRKHLGGALGRGRVTIPAIAYNEARSNLRKDVVNRVDKNHVDMVWLRARSVINERLRNALCVNNHTLVDEAREMYKAAGSPKSQKFAEWYSRKSRHVARPSLGSGNDLVILSTVAQNAKRGRVEFWTGDIDFTMFADEIAAKFNVEVVDASRLDERFAG